VKIIRTTTSGVLLGLALVGVACDGDSADVLPELEPPVLEPVARSLTLRLEGTPSGIDDDRLAQLQDLMETAFVPGVDANLASRARDALLAEPDAHWALERGLRHEQPVVRSNAAYQLGQLEVQAALVPLVRRLKYEKVASCKVWVIDALARLGNHSGLRELASLMVRGPRSLQADDLVQAGEISIGILDRAHHPIGRNPSYSELQSTLGELDRTWRRRGFVDAIAPTGDLTRLRIDRLLLDLAQFQLRSVDDARFVLQRLGVAAVPALRTALHAQNNYLRNHALEVIRDIGPAAADAADDVLALLGDRISAPYAVQALGAMQCARAAPRLTSFLRGGDRELQMAAAGALGPIGDASTIPALRRLLRDTRATLDARVQAAFSLALLEHGGEGYTFLTGMRNSGRYHEPTLRELLDRLPAK